MLLVIQMRGLGGTEGEEEREREKEGRKDKEGERRKRTGMNIDVCVDHTHCPERPAGLGD